MNSFVNEERQTDRERERERERERDITIQYSGNYALPGSRVINLSAKNVTRF